MAWRQRRSIVIVVVLASILGVGFAGAQSPAGTFDSSRSYLRQRALVTTPVSRC
jgi:hypothetical protein